MKTIYNQTTIRTGYLPCSSVIAAWEIWEKQEKIYFVCIAQNMFILKLTEQIQFLFQCQVCSIALILDGNSELGAHLCCVQSVI